MQLNIHSKKPLFNFNSIYLMLVKYFTLNLKGFSKLKLSLNERSLWKMHTYFLHIELAHKKADRIKSYHF